MAKKKKAELTLREQCELLHGDGYWHIAGVPRLNVPPFEMHDGPVGLRYAGENEAIDFGSEKKSICYPSPCLTACSFDVDLLYKIGQSIGEECLAAKTNMILAPGVNIKRSPLCGRNFEYFSEDPLLSGKLGAAFVGGVQSVNVGACVKHYCCNNQEIHRMVNESVVDDRALHELYLKPFEIVVKESDPWAVMSSYNRINGFYASDNDYLLKNVLKEEWGYDGVVMSDWGGTNDYIDSHNHGLDLEMPCLYKKRTNELMRAALSHRLTHADLSDASSRVLAMLRKGAKAKKNVQFDYEAGHALAISAAEKSMVLLKNDGVLPLKNFNDCCVIGELASNMHYQGMGSSLVVPYKMQSFIDLINANRKKPVPYAKGYSFSGDENPEGLITDAIEVASNAKTAIVFIGLSHTAESEGYDRENMLLPEDQIRLLEAVSEVNQNLIVILNCGSPVELPFLSNCRGLLLSYLGGEGISEALQHILLGEVSPSGRLPETWPIHLLDTPCFGFYPGFADYSLYKESIFVGYRYYLSAEKEVNFPFGFGLSYATFKYAISANKTSINEDETVQVSVKVTNTSKVASEEVVQLYAEPRGGNVFKPLRTLIAFTKVHLEPKETKAVVFEINASAFAHFDVESKKFATESGVYAIQVGASCADIVASLDLNVNAQEFESAKEQFPGYYSIMKDGFLQYDDNFSNLLGRPFPNAIDHRSRPFNMNSTMRDISWTWIGKLMVKEFEKMIGMSINDPKAKLFTATFLGTPIRNISMGNKKYANPKYCAAILAMANGYPLLALGYLIFGVRKG